MCEKGYGVVRHKFFCILWRRLFELALLKMQVLGLCADKSSGIRSSARPEKARTVKVHPSEGAFPGFDGRTRESVHRRLFDLTDYQDIHRSVVGLQVKAELFLQRFREAGGCVLAGRPMQ